MKSRLKKRKKEYEQKYKKTIIVDTDELNRRKKEAFKRINELFDDVDIKDKHIFKTGGNKNEKSC